MYEQQSRQPQIFYSLWSPAIGDFIVKLGCLETLLDEIAWQAHSGLDRSVIYALSKDVPKSFQDKFKLVRKLIDSDLVAKPERAILNLGGWPQIDVLVSEILEFRNAVAHGQVSMVSKREIVFQRFKLKRIEPSKTHSATYQNTEMKFETLARVNSELAGLMLVMELIIQGISHGTVAWNEMEVHRTPNALVREIYDLHHEKMLNAGYIRIRNGSDRLNKEEED